MASVKISELNELLSITSDDYLAIVDSGSQTTYRASFNTINDWMSVYGSASFAISASHAVMADTASHVVSASYALRATTSSYALTASYYDVSGYSPGFATSASYASTASCLHGNGTSWEKYMQISGSLKLSGGAWIGIPRKLSVLSESRYANSVYFNTSWLSAGTDDWARIYYMENFQDKGRLVFEHGDNLVYHNPGDDYLLLPKGPDIDYLSMNYPGFLWQTYADIYEGATGSLMFLRTNGDLFLRSATARNFTASVVGEGFHGTASWAQNLVGGAGTLVEPPIGSIMDYAGTSAPADTNWKLCDGSELSQAGYPTLYALLGTTWGTAAAGNFKLPDLRKRMTIGAGTPGNYRGSVGDTGGSENLNIHYHLIGRSSFGLTEGGGAKCGLADCVWVNDQPVNLNSSFPTMVAPNGKSHATFLIWGEERYTNQPYGAFPQDGLGNSSAFVLGSSFGFVVDNGHQDINPPYAVCNKIIRVS